MRSTDAIGHNRGRQSRSPEADYRLRGNVRLALDVFNLFDAEASDIDYLYTSRLPGEPADGLDDIHFHPTLPRTARLDLIAGF
jgi:hypothetical protein